MKTIVKGAIILLLVAALAGSAEAGRQLAASSYPAAGSLAGVLTTNNTLVIGETDLAFAGLTDTSNTGARGRNVCAQATLTGQPSTSTQGVGTVTISQNGTSVGLGLVAGPYTLTCGADINGTISAVNPTYSVVIRSAQPGKYGTTISSIASGDNITINTTSNLNKYITRNSNSPGAGTAGQPTGQDCAMDLILRQQGTSPNKLAARQPWAGNISDIGAAPQGADVLNGLFTQLSLSPTTDYPAGTYQFSMAPTNTTGCNGISAESAVLATLTVTTAGITFKADKTSAGINDIVTFTLSTSPFKNVSFELTSGDATKLSLVTIDADSFQSSRNANENTVTALNTNITGATVNSLFAQTVGNVTAVTNSGGTATMQVKFTKDGTFEFQANQLKFGSVNNQFKDTAIQPVKVSVTVAQVSATLKTDKTTAFLGQDVTISGTVTAGQNVVVSINDKAEVLATVQADKTFSYLWTAARTRLYSAGSVKISAWVCPQTVHDGSVDADTGKAVVAAVAGASPCANALTLGQSGSTGTDTKDGICGKGAASSGAAAGAAAGLTTGCDTSAKKSADASWSVNMQDQSVSVDTPTSGQGVAQSDQFTVKGSASGAIQNKVFLWVFNTQGTTSGGKCYASTIGTTSADQGYTWTKTLGKSEVTRDSGDYTLVVQSLGRDGIYADGKQLGGTGTAAEVGKAPTDNTLGTNLFCADDSAPAGSSLLNKLGSQILSILQDNALNKAGSDDQGVFKVVQFKVVNPSIKLNACASTVKGSALNVSGTSNRADGTTIIVSATGPKTLAPQTVTVKNGTFSGTFSAAAIGADVGTYTVTGDDLQGQKDSVTCSVVAGNPCSLSVSVSASKTQVEKGETSALTATVSNSGDEACTGTQLASTVTPSTGATVTWAATSADVPAKGSSTVSGNFSASAEASYTVSVTATRGAATANGSVSIGVGKAMAATPAPSAAATSTPPPAASTAPAATPKPSPGFEAVFAVAGLLAVAYLVNRRKR